MHIDAAKLLSNYSVSQSTFQKNKIIDAPSIVDKHVAVIMDGNGRWAMRHNLARIKGHAHGVHAVRKTVELARRAEVLNLTLYAFSSDNWKRSPQEVGSLMSLFSTFLNQEKFKLKRNDIRLSVVGRRDRLKPVVVERIESTERVTRTCQSMHLRLAIDYSARYQSSLAKDCDIPDVDLLIRTGGEKRLSDFLLLESAYAELEFIDVLWPDFDEIHWHRVVQNFLMRDRRYGNVTSI